MSPLAGLKNLRWVVLLPRLRRGLNDCARFAGFQATTDFRLTLMGGEARESQGGLSKFDVQIWQAKCVSSGCGLLETD
jgi:hypothetical protein